MFTLIDEALLSIRSGWAFPAGILLVISLVWDPRAYALFALVLVLWGFVVVARSWWRALKSPKTVCQRFSYRYDPMELIAFISGMVAGGILAFAAGGTAPLYGLILWSLGAWAVGIMCFVAFSYVYAFVNLFLLLKEMSRYGPA
jgi:hypothetical protein